MDSPIISDDYLLDSAKPLSEGSFGCVLKVDIKGGSRSKFDGSSSIAIKLDQILSNAEEINYGFWKDSFDMTKRVSDLQTVNPFVVKCYGGYRLMMNQPTFDFITRLGAKCPSFAKKVNERLDASEKSFWRDYQRAEDEGEVPDELKEASLDKWSRIKYDDPEYSIGIIEMELVNGGSFRDVLANGKIQKSEVPTLCMQLCWSLYVLQRELELIHYDIKPANVLVKLAKEEQRYRLVIDADTSFDMVIPVGGMILAISDFGVSVIPRTREPPSGGHWAGNWLFNPPTGMLLAELKKNRDFDIGRGPDSDVWMMGNILCSIALNGWKLPDNDAGIAVYGLDHIAELMIPDTRGGRNLKTFDEAYSFADFVIKNVQSYENANPKDSLVMKNLKALNEKKGTLAVMLAMCQFEYYLGNGFLPSPDEVPNKPYNYRLGTVSEVIAKSRFSVLELGIKFAKGKENIFSTAVEHIRTTHGAQFIDVLKKMLGWLPEQRRVNSSKYYESGAFLENIIRHGYFEHMISTGESSSREFGYSKVISRRQNNTLLLGTTIDPSQSYYVRLIKEKGIRSAYVARKSDGRRTCNHSVEPDSMKRWLETKAITDNMCPLCK